MKVLYATLNKGKLVEVGQVFGKYGLEVVSPKDLGIEMEVPETGQTLEANAAMKVRMFAERLMRKNAGSVKLPLTPSSSEEGESLLFDKEEGREQFSLVIMADDAGLEIDALGGEPGVKVRRWRDGVTKMSDEEIVGFCLEKMQTTPPEARGARFRSVTVLKFPDSEDAEYFNGSLRGMILEQVKEGVKIEGFPLDGLFYVPDWQMVLGEVYKLPETERVKYQTHREIALNQALERVLEWGAWRG